MILKLAEQKRDYTSAVGATAGSAIGTGAASLGTLASMPWLTKKMDQKGQATAQDVNSYIKKNKLQDVRIHKGTGVAPGPHYMPGKVWQKATGEVAKDTVYMGGVKSKDIMMHELGHAKDFKKAPVAKMRLRGGAIGLGLLAGAGLATDDRTRKYTGAAVGAGYAPTLWQEGKATGSAVKHLVKRRGLKGLRSLKTLGPAFGTYAGLAGLSAAGAHYGAKLLKEQK